MATFRKVGKGWRAEVYRRGVRKSAIFPSKGAAVAWAGRVENEIMAGVRGEIPDLTFDALLERYEPISKGKKSGYWELGRIASFRRARIASVPLRRLGAVHAAEWRDERLKQVSEASVRREMTIMARACAVAIKEWRWLRENPFAGINRPKDGKPRTRIATDAEIAVLLERASPNMARVIRFALETGMRAGEIAGLRAEDIAGNVATLRDTKNGTSREVPLSKLALEQITAGRGNAEGVTNPQGVEAPHLFGLTAGSISGMFAKLCRDAKITGLTFHDLRRTAIVRLSKKLDPMTLAKMVGHRDLKMTLNVYYAVNMSDVAALLE